ncbi:MAG: hypothetical protein L0H31_07820 [Nocardioidaceae bacterium]|nr:hypothetical protein [Nocardioidaceae bacterium]
MLVALLLAVSLALVGCSRDSPAPTYSGGESNPSVAKLLQRTLNQRAVALSKDNVAGFRRTLDRSDSGLIDDEQTYFDNLTQLPIESFRLRLVRNSLQPVEGSEDYWAELVVALQLRGYDDAPVRTRDRFLFTPSSNGKRMLISSTSDYRWEGEHPANVLPWDRGTIHVDESAGVLGIFDDSTWPHAEAVIDAASLGRYDVRTAMGVAGTPDETGVVVYALQDPTFVRGVASQTIGDPDRADGLTIAMPVDATKDNSPIASYRIFLNPRILTESDAVLARLVRHELTHAVLGPRGRRAPLWLTEGLAEFVSVLPMPASERRLPADALEVGRSATGLPGEAEFSGSDAKAWYAVSWWVCEYIARAYGQPVLLDLLDEFDEGTDQSQVLSEALGISAAELTQRGVALMATTYNGRTG